MKVKRQNKILEMIERYNIETQEELIEKLRMAGFEVTQATVSRDIHELKLTKQQLSGGGYRYMVPAEGGEGVKIYDKAVAGSVKSVDYSMNNVVVRTYPGMAQAVAAGIDTLRDENILGCVAGDDCIIVVTRDTESAKALAERMRSRRNG